MVFRRVSLVAAVLLGMLVLLGAAPAAGASESARVSLDVAEPLTSVDDPVEITVRGFVDEIWVDAEIQVMVYGPGRPGDETGAEMVRSWPVNALEPQQLGVVQDSFSTVVTVAPEYMVSPGAYWISASVSTPSGQMAQANAWVGRVPVDPPPIEVAMVWSSILGVHWDPDGRLVDGALEALVVPNADAPGSLYALFALPERFPSWHTTMAVEPILLSNLRGMADGFDRLEESGEFVTVGPEEELPLLSTQALSTFRRVARLESFQILPGPYAMPDLPVLAREGWEDGVEQVRLGRREAESTLSMAGAPDGAYSPGLELTTDSLKFFSKASVDYVLVAEEVARDLVEDGSAPPGPVRVRDQDNNRLTLLFADEDLREVMGPPWDPDLLLAVLAAKIADGDPGPFIVAPTDDYGLPPAYFVNRVGASLTGAEWIGTLTLDELIGSHPPATRPVFLTRYGGYLEGFVKKSYLESLRAGHASLADLSGAVPEDLALLDRLRLLMFQAEGRYWFLNSSDPDIVNLGLASVRRVQEEVAAYFDKVDVAEGKSVLVVGDEGEVPIAVVNKTKRPLDVELVVESEGLTFRGGSHIAATLGVQENIFSLPVTTKGTDAVVSVRVMAGDTLVDEGSVQVRFISARPFLPWALAALVAVVLGGWLLARLRRSLSSA